MKMYDNRFVVSKRHPDIKNNQSHLLKEHTNCISSVTDWINNTYDKSKGRKKNEIYFKQMVLEYKKSCYEELNEKLKNSGLASAGYYLTDYALNNPAKLSKFHLDCRIDDESKKFILSGTYEKMIDFLNNNTEKLLQKNWCGKECLRSVALKKNVI